MAAEFQQIVGWFAGLGGTGTMAVGLYALHKRWFVHHSELDGCLEREKRERDRAERAEQRLIETIPVLTRAYEQLARAPAVAEKVAEKAAEVVKTVIDGGKERK
jgi:hypothetical protein